ncbi:MAG: transporter [Pirellulales bacterium]|nr:transporter [Pirellulales bacterium]
MPRTLAIATFGLLIFGCRHASCAEQSASTRFAPTAARATGIPHATDRPWPSWLIRGQAGEEPLVTDRPDFTESSSTVGLRRLQIESGYTYLRDASAGVTTDGHLLPELLLRYGVSDDFELRVFWAGYAFEKERDAATRSSRQGSSDVAFGFKRDLLSQDGWTPEAAAIASVSLPCGHDDFGSPQADTELRLAYGWEINDWLSVGANTGAGFGAPEGVYRSTFLQSIAAGVVLTDRLGMYHEWIGLMHRGADDSRPEHYYNGGLTFLLSPNLQLDWRAGVGLTKSAGDFFTGAGCSVRW